MKQLLIFIFCICTFRLSAQSVPTRSVVITDINSKKLPGEIKYSLQNLSQEQIESFKQKGEFKTQTKNTSLKYKYSVRIEDNVLVGAIESNNISIPVNVKMIWYCDHDPRHTATSRAELKENTEKYNCKNWSAQ